MGGKEGRRKKEGRKEGRGMERARREARPRGREGVKEEGMEGERGKIKEGVIDG